MTYKYTQFYSEKQLYNFLKTHFIDDLIPTAKSARFDCYSKKYKLNVELKCRRKHYNDLMLEKKKYDSIIERSNALDMLPVYVNSTPLGVWAFYLLGKQYDWSHKDLPQTTQWNKNKIKKEVTYLNISQGIDLLSLLPFGKL